MSIATRKADPIPARAAAYCALYPMLHAIARDHGYALAVHGSVHRDFDLVAVPWIEEAAEPLELIKAFKEATATVTHHEEADELVPDCRPTAKPHGRISYSLHVTNSGMYRGYLDISVLPKTNPTPSPAPTQGAEERAVYLDILRRISDPGQFTKRLYTDLNGTYETVSEWSARVVMEVVAQLRQQLSTLQAQLDQVTRERIEGKCCILNVDSPTIPPTDDERWQCRCRQCVKDLLADIISQRDAALAEVEKLKAERSALSREIEDAHHYAGIDWPGKDVPLLEQVSSLVSAVTGQFKDQESQLRAQRAALEAERARLREAAEETRVCLNYVLYARFPMGDKVCDHIPQEWYERSHNAIENAKALLAQPEAHLTEEVKGTV